jgi:hypothetical protein
VDEELDAVKVTQNIVVLFLGASEFTAKKYSPHRHTGIGVMESWSEGFETQYSVTPTPHLRRVLRALL